MDGLRFDALDENGTEALGIKIAGALFPGAFIAMYGGLGAGKTTLTVAIAGALGIRGVTSPTFTIVREHTQGRLPLFHFDAYRLSSAEELYGIGFDDYLERNGVIIMEWCENVPEALPDDRLEIRLSGMGDAPRTAIILATGPRHGSITEALK